MSDLDAALCVGMDAELGEAEETAPKVSAPALCVDNMSDEQVNAALRFAMDADGMMAPGMVPSTLPTILLGEQTSMGYLNLSHAEEQLPRASVPALSVADMSDEQVNAALRFAMDSDGMVAPGVVPSTLPTVSLGAQTSMGYLTLPDEQAELLLAGALGTSLDCNGVPPTPAADAASALAGTQVGADSRCPSCDSMWSSGAYSPSCLACGGAALTKPCCACGGQCGAVWRRDLQTTRSLGLGSFTGECNLSNDDLEEVMWRSMQAMHEQDEEGILSQAS